MIDSELLNLLAGHRGRERGISARALAGVAGMSMRRLRAAISAMREEGIAICGTPSTGYFVAVTPEELRQTCEFLEHRALHSLMLLSRLQRVSLPELMGQLRVREIERAAAPALLASKGE